MALSISALIFVFIMFGVVLSNDRFNDNESIDDYHFPMVADAIRNDLYYAALRKAIIPNNNMTVLDVGAGTMLLSMMSYNLGAAKVIGVEMNPTMSKIAESILRVNNFSDQFNSGDIGLFKGPFETLQVGHQLVSTLFSFSQMKLP